MHPSIARLELEGALRHVAAGGEANLDVVPGPRGEGVANLVLELLALVGQRQALPPQDEERGQLAHHVADAPQQHAAHHAHGRRAQQAGTASGGAQAWRG